MSIRLPKILSVCTHCSSIPLKAMVAAGKMHRIQGNRRIALSADFIMVHHHIFADNIARQARNNHSGIPSTDEVPGNADIMAALVIREIFIVCGDAVAFAFTLADRIAEQIIVQDVDVAASVV